MDWSTILGSGLGGTLGFIGALATKGLSVWEARQNHRMELERLEMASRIDLQKADLTLRQTQEEQAGNTFSAAIQSAAAATPATPWVQDFMSLWRPGLTLVLVLVAAVQGFVAGGTAREFLFLSIATLASQAVGFWFGVRTIEKRWGLAPVSSSFGGRT